MKKNVGIADKVIRITLAVLITILYLTHVVSGAWGIVLLVIAAILLLTSFVSTCPLYAIFGIRTCPLKRK